jgi:hypothetical protein
LRVDLDRQHCANHTSTMRYTNLAPTP